MKSLIRHFPIHQWQCVLSNLEKNFVFKKSIIHLNREKTVTSAINISRYSWILITNIPCMVKYI